MFLCNTNNSLVAGFSWRLAYFDNRCQPKSSSFFCKQCCIGLVVQTCLPLDFLASVIMAFKQALATEQTTSTTSERTGQLFTCNRLTSITLRPQCMAVTLHMTRASLVGAASSNIICRSWIPDQCVAPSASCSFVHKYLSCFGRQCVGDCPGD